MSDVPSLRRIDPSGVCVGTIERCKEEDASFVPVTERDLVRVAASQGRDTVGTFTLMYDVPGDSTLAFEGEGNRHRTRTELGDLVSDTGLLVVDRGKAAMGADGRVFLEVQTGVDRSAWSVPVWSGTASSVHAHSVAMVAVPLVVIGWLALAGLQQVTAPRRSAQTVGAYATAVLNVATMLRVASMQYVWTSWWTRAPAARRFVEVATIPVVTAAALTFYLWLCGVSVRARGMTVLALGVATVLCLLALATGVPSLRGPALTVAQSFMVVAAVASSMSLFRAWHQLPVDERVLIGVGAGAVCVSTVLDVIMARCDTPLLLGSGVGPLGVAAEVLCQSLILARRDARAHAEVSRLATLAKEASERELGEQARVNTELQRLDALKDAFVANTSHELQTPLNGVVGLAESLLESKEELPPRAMQGLRTILASGKRLERLVSDLLDFSKARQGELSLELVGVDVAVAASEALVLLAPSVGTKDVRLTSHVPGALPLARADETRLAQALQHVIGNAIKFTERGEVRCDARRGDQRVVITVEDSGPGFPQEMIDKGVAAFEQGDGSSTRAHGGTGLGLAFAKRLMELQGGTLRIANRAQGGARVELELPLAPLGQQRSPRARVAPVTSIAPPARRSVPPLSARGANAREISMPTMAPIPKEAAAPRAVTAPRGPAASNRGARPLRLLVADDEPINLERIEMDLENANCELVLVDNGAAAVEAFDAQGPFDLVLLDVMMPKLDGLGACRAIRERVAMTEVPVVMVTAKREPKDLEAGFEAGANDYLTKPYVRQELLQRVRAHANVARMTRSMQRYVPQPFASLLGRKHLADIELGDAVEKDVAVVFVDIRGFTAASERMTSRQVFSWLNDQFGAIVPAFHAQGGIVDKYLGDAVMALFPRGARSAVDGVVAAARALGASPDAADVGFGIHQGSTMVGALGEATRLAPTVVSDTVNVAARLEALTRRFGASALLSEEALEASGRQRLATRYIGAFRLKGRTKAMRIHELLDASGPEEAAARRSSSEHLDAVLEHLEARRFAEALAAAERGCDAHPKDAVLAFYVTAVDAICSAGAPYDGAIDLGEK